MKVLGLIPARADSSGCIAKNLRVLGSKPLIQWTVDAWLAAGRDIRDLVLSTESPQIMRIFHGSGIRFVDQGPRSDDPTKIIDQVLDFWPDTEILLYLQPTTPFKSPENILKSIGLIENGAANSVVTMMEIPKCFHPRNAFLEDDFGHAINESGEGVEPSRQNLRNAYSRDGGIYAFRTMKVWKDHISNNMYAHPCVIIKTDPIDYCNIDTEEDWKEAQWRAAEIERVKVVA